MLVGGGVSAPPLSTLSVATERPDEMGRVYDANNPSGTAVVAGTNVGRATAGQFVPVSGGSEWVDPFEDDTPIACDADSPEFCEACD